MVYPSITNATKSLLKRQQQTQWRLIISNYERKISHLFTHNSGVICNAYFVKFNDHFLIMFWRWSESLDFTVLELGVSFEFRIKKNRNEK